MSLLDKLSNTSARAENFSIFYYDFYTEKWSKIEEIETIKDLNLINWSIPENYNYSIMKFRIDLNNNTRYIANSSYIETIPPMIIPSQSNLFHINEEITLQFELELLNGTPIRNQIIFVQVANNNFTLLTNNSGIIEFNIITSNRPGIISIYLEYSGLEEKKISSTNYEYIIWIDHSLKQKFLYYIFKITSFLGLFSFISFSGGFIAKIMISKFYRRKIIG
jgi:hypothetical protein